MSRVGITGHIALSPLAGDMAAAWEWVELAMGRELLDLPAPLIGLSALAAGSDQRFARLVLDRGGQLEAFLPFSGYRQLVRGEALVEFDSLWEKAAKREILHPEIDVPFGDEARNRLYTQASRQIVDASDRMFAVWERGRGGSSAATYHNVEYARQKARPLTIFDPRERKVLREQ